jgi:hypothetical protein
VIIPRFPAETMMQLMECTFWPHPKRFQKSFSNFLRVALVMNGIVALAWEGIWTGSFEGVREVVWPLSVRLVSFGAYRVTVLKLFGWKCWFLWALAFVVGSPF